MRVLLHTLGGVDCEGDRFLVWDEAMSEDMAEDVSIGAAKSSEESRERVGRLGGAFKERSGQKVRNIGVGTEKGVERGDRKVRGYFEQNLIWNGGERHGGGEGVCSGRENRSL